MTDRNSRGPLYSVPKDAEIAALKRQLAEAEAREERLREALVWIELSAKPDHPAPGVLIDSLKRCATAALSGKEPANG